MRKFFLLLSLIASLYSVKAQSYKYHKVRDLGTTYSQANTNFCNNTLGQEIKLNLYITTPLSVGQIYFIENIDGVDRYVKVIQRSYSSNQDADEFVDGTNIGPPINFTCIVDSDGDGIEDSQDNCPNNANANQSDIDNDGIGDACDSQDNRDSDGDGVQNYEDDCSNEAGSASNNGCPGSPDLSINLSGSTISSDCFNCETFFQYIGTDRHYLNSPSGIAIIDVFVQNLGEATSSSSTVGFYISADNTYQSNADTRIKTVNVGSLASNSGTYATGSLFVSDFNSVGGNFYLLIRVDDNNANNESNENNNVFALRFAIY